MKYVYGNISSFSWNVATAAFLVLPELRPPQLVGKAQQAYAVLSPDDAKDYAILKKAILLRYDINEESYRQRFRVASRKDYVIGVVA